MEVYPIEIDGEIFGELKTEKTGGRTRFEASCRMLDGIVRISVYGGGKEGYLGVLAPSGGKLFLEKKLSALDMRGFPENIEWVGRAGQKQEQEKAEEMPEMHEIREQESERKEDLPGPEDGETDDDIDDVYWYSSPDGALVCFDGRRSLIALPPDDPRVPDNIDGERKIIEGREYIVYSVNSGSVL